MPSVLERALRENQAILPFVLLLPREAKARADTQATRPRPRHLMASVLLQAVVTVRVPLFKDNGKFLRVPESSQVSDQHGFI